MYFDKQGYKIDFDTWKRLLQVDGYAELFTDKLDGGCIVRTVWLGVSANQNKVEIFETTVFGGALDGSYERYSTMGEALAGHKGWLRKIERQMMFGSDD